jgi:hypothetical protein
MTRPRIEPHRLIDHLLFRWRLLMSSANEICVVTIRDNWITLRSGPEDDREPRVFSFPLREIRGVADLYSQYTRDLCAHVIVPSIEHIIVETFRARQVLEAIHAGKGEFRFEVAR